MAVSWTNFVPPSNIPDTPKPPYTNLPGSGPGANGADPETLLANDTAARFKSYSWKPGDPLVPPTGTQPKGFSMNPTYEDYSTWTSEWQAYFLDLRRNQSGNYNSVTLLDANGGQHHVIRSMESSKAYDLELLQKRDFAAMSLADQQNVAADPYFRNTLASGLGLTTDSSTLVTLINAKIKSLDDLATGDKNWTGTYTEDLKVFKQEYQNLLTRMNTMGVFNLTDINNKIDEIQKRFTRMREFALCYARNDPTNTTGAFTGIPSVLDNGAGFKRAYDIFMAQERRVLEMDNQRLKLANEGTIGSKKLDAPTLVYLFQQYTMLQVEAINNALGEEVNQFNAVLKLYQAMQSKINEIVKAFNPSKSDQTRNYLGQEQNDVAVDGTDKLRLNFEQGVFQFHPLEIIYGIDRPRQDMGNNNGKYNRFYRDGWNAFSTQLGDRVTQFNQESQILMNKVNSTEKEKNRYFEQANSALSKLYDVMNNVARAI